MPVFKTRFWSVLVGVCLVAGVSLGPSLREVGAQVWQGPSDMNDICAEFNDMMREFEQEEDPETRRMIQTQLQAMRTQCANPNASNPGLWAGECQRQQDQIRQQLAMNPPLEVRKALEAQLRQLQEMCSRPVTVTRPPQAPPPQKQVQVDEYLLLTDLDHHFQFGDGNFQMNDIKQIQGEIKLQVYHNRVGVDGSGTMRYKQARGYATVTDPPCNVNWDASGQTAPAKIIAYVDEGSSYGRSPWVAPNAVSSQYVLNVMLHDIDTPQAVETTQSKCGNVALVDSYRRMESMNLVIPLYDGASAREDQSGPYTKSTLTGRLKKLRTFYVSR